MRQEKQNVVRSPSSVNMRMWIWMWSFWSHFDIWFVEHSAIKAVCGPYIRPHSFVWFLFLHRIICNAAQGIHLSRIGRYSFGNILSTFYSKMDIQLKSEQRVSVKTAPAQNERTHILQIFSIFASSHSLHSLRSDSDPILFIFWFLPLNSNGSGSLENISNFNYMYFERYI